MQVMMSGGRHENLLAVALTKGLALSLARKGMSAVVAVGTGIREV